MKYNENTVQESPCPPPKCLTNHPTLKWEHMNCVRSAQLPKWRGGKTHGLNPHRPWTGSDRSTRPRGWNHIPTPRLHDSSSRSLWLSLSLRYLPIRELSAELKAPRGEPVTQYTAHCCAHISNCQDATFSPVKRQTPELGKHQTPSKLVTESIWAEAGGMRKPHSQGHVQVQVSYLRGSNTRHRCCLW